MKRITKILFYAGVATAMLASCQKEIPHRHVTLLDKPAELSLSIDGVEETIGLIAPKTKAYNIHVTAGSVSDQMLTVTIAPNPDKVAEYNAANNTNYDMVPGDAYEISNKTFLIPRYNTEGTTSTVTLKASGLPDDEKVRVLPITITKVEGEDDFTVKDSTVFITVYRISTSNIRFEKGTGTAADPFLVEVANDMYALNNDLKDGEANYVKLAADIDMSTIEEWMPVNITTPYKTIHFDGDGHTIKKMKAVSNDMSSLFGVITGSVKNVNFEDCTVEIGKGNAGAGLIAAQAIDAELTGIKATGTVIKSTTNATGSGKHLGGLVGLATNTKFKDINIEVDVIDGNEDGIVTRMIGGLVGLVLPEMTDDDNKIKAFTEKDKNHCTFENCHTSGSIFGYHYCGGFIGVAVTENTVIKNCSADVDMNFTTGGNYGGGFIGYANKGLTVTGCHATGDIDNVGNYKGGFIGAMQGNATIKRCYHEGNLTNTTGTHVGGFIGNLGVKTGEYNTEAFGDSVVEDCYRIGNHTVTAGSGNSGRMNAGFIAMMENTKNCTVSRCYSSGDVSAKGSNGPISGFIAMIKMAQIPQEMNCTVEYCIAWNKKVESNTTNADTWSSGAIVGVSSNTNTMTDCYRRADMEYIEKCGEDVYTLFDQENSSASAPLAYDPNAHKGYKCPYHGKAAPAGATCSQVAKTLGWSEEVWDLSGEMPKLK